ncbi:hypothetical protein LguiB_025937 [Lonicera macranthoides]
MKLYMTSFMNSFALGFGPQAHLSSILLGEDLDKYDLPCSLIVRTRSRLEYALA